MSGSGEFTRVGDILQKAGKDLEAAGVAEADSDAALLLGHCLGKTRTELYLATRETIDHQAEERFHTFLKRRKEREPVSYIIGEREFWSLPFFVSPAVLIPRPETEFLLETALAHYNRNCRRSGVLDLCCGSGVIAVVLAREMGRVVTGVDISKEALEVSRKNCLRHEVGSAVRLIQADLLSSFSSTAPFSLIVSNPPYVRRDEIERELQPEVALYEPRLALDGGVSGLELIAGIRDRLPDVLCAGGDLFMEIGDHQGDTVRAMFLRPGNGHEYERVQVFRDYSGRERVVHVRRS